ncbi:hypothetical protein [Microbulbifer sp. VAAF005]|uniref:hypothetical protein n=1 Tax=Microbulbifer sp. VAAF005 TaxID=3034230 RepID=UPI0024AD90AC|nr:hypothetical protein [Microbulbifer sp. VAAF005]WHI46448.1 hypothetical protein P0078_22510 [Microbulbifer sp. VAAF005]
MASYTVSLLNPKIIEDLNLHEHGLEIKLRPQSNFFPLSDRKSLSFHKNLLDTQAEVARFSERDAATLPDFYAMLESVANILREELLRSPPMWVAALRTWCVQAALV